MGQIQAQTSRKCSQMQALTPKMGQNPGSDPYEGAEFRPKPPQNVPKSRPRPPKWAKIQARTPTNGPNSGPNLPKMYPKPGPDPQNRPKSRPGSLQMGRIQVQTCLKCTQIQAQVCTSNIGPKVRTGPPKMGQIRPKIGSKHLK